MKQKMVLKRLSILLCVVINLLVLAGICSVPAAAAVSTVYTLPFDDHDRWYSEVGGSPTGGTLVYGYLNSKTPYLNFTYANGIANVAPTGESVKQKGFWNGYCIGWISINYKYDEPIEIDLNQVALQYDVSAEKEWDVKFYFLNSKEEEYKDGISLKTILGITGDVYGKAGDYSGSVVILDAIQKNYLSSKKEIGLTKGTKVKLARVTVNYHDSKSQEIHNVAIKKLRLVKDTSIPDTNEPVSSESPSSTEVSSSSSSSEVSSAVTSSEPIEPETGFTANLLLTIIISVIAVLVLAGAGTAVYILRRKRNKQE